MMTEKMFKELNQSELEKTIGGKNKDFLIVGPFDWFKKHLIVGPFDWFKKHQGKSQKHM